jgi:hypothetical protein
MAMVVAPWSYLREREKQRKDSAENTEARGELELMPDGGRIL